MFNFIETPPHWLLLDRSDEEQHVVDGSATQEILIFMGVDYSGLFEGNPIEVTPTLPSTVRK